MLLSSCCTRSAHHPFVAAEARQWPAGYVTMRMCSYCGSQSDCYQADDHLCVSLSYYSGGSVPQPAGNAGPAWVLCRGGAARHRIQTPSHNGHTAVGFVDRAVLESMLSDTVFRAACMV